MKTMSPELKAHLASGSTTVTTCWRIQRQDGKVFSYTEHDADITYLGETYKAMGGFNKTAIKSSGNLAVDNMEVTGFLTDDTIPETELRNGAFDYAQVEIFLVNYEDLSMGSCKLRFGYFGEVSTVPSGAFLVELRGLIDLLTTKIGNVYIPECRLDVGDKKCKIKLIPDQHGVAKTYKVGDRVVALLNAPSGFFADYEVKNFSDEIDLMGFWALFVKRKQANLFMSPMVGEWYLEFSQAETSRNVNLLTETPLTASQIDSGLFYVEAEFFMTGREHGNGGKVELEALNAAQNSVIDKDSYSKQLLPVRKWEKHTLKLPLRAGMRYLRWRVYPSSTDAYSVQSLAIDGMKLTVKQLAVEASDFRIFGGIEFECTTAGTTDVVAPTFDVTLGNTTTDGGVVWTAVRPKWMFLDNVAVEPTNSNTLILSNMDMPTAGWFNWGVIKFLSGPNVGFAVEVMSYDNATKTLKTVLPIPFKSQVGDLIQIQVGCDKRRRTCIEKFNNILEFRGFPDVPGQGQYFKVAGLD